MPWVVVKRPYVTRDYFLRVLEKHHLHEDDIVLNAMEIAKREHGPEQREAGGRKSKRGYLERHVYPAALQAMRIRIKNRNWFRKKNGFVPLNVVVAAMLTHDTLEKFENGKARQQMTSELREKIGEDAADIVLQLTKQIRPRRTNRKADYRQKLVRDHRYALRIADAAPYIQALKLIDKLKNGQDPPNDPKQLAYLRVTMREYQGIAGSLEPHEQNSGLRKPMQDALDKLDRMARGKGVIEIGRAGWRLDLRWPLWKMRERLKNQ